MFSAGVITKTGQIYGKAFTTKEEAENYILDLMEKEDLKRARIKNLTTGEEDIII